MSLKYIKNIPDRNDANIECLRTYNVCEGVLFSWTIP